MMGFLFSSSSSSSNFESSESDLFPEEVNSNSSDDQNGPLQDMSSLLIQLPLKRGLSEYYNGKSESFTCLSYVRSLKDLAKPENPYNKKKKKKLKSCRSDGGILEGVYGWGTRKQPSRNNEIIAKKTSTELCTRRDISKASSFVCLKG